MKGTIMVFRDPEAKGFAVVCHIPVGEQTAATGLTLPYSHALELGEHLAQALVECIRAVIGECLAMAEDHTAGRIIVH